MKYRDVEFGIRVGGVVLPEYELVVDEEQKTVACWVASEEGETFKISVKNRSEHQDYEFAILVDGRRVRDLICGPRMSSAIDGAHTSADFIRPFIFSRIQLTDEEAPHRNSPPNLAKLGTIQISVLRCVELNKVPWKKSQVHDFNSIGPVHERAKKAGVHCVSLGEEQKVKPTYHVKVNRLDSMEKPYCVFYFRYRSQEMLQAQGIIPITRRSPVQQNTQGTGESSGSRKRARASVENGDSQATVKEELEQSDGEDPDALQAHLDAMAADMEALRAQVSRARDRKRVKREPSPIRLEASGDVIDLTLD